MPRSVFNSLLLIMVVAVGRACLGGVMLVTPNLKELLAIPLLLGLSGVLLKFLPDSSRAWVTSIAIRMLSGNRTSVVLGSLLALESVAAVGIAPVVVVWTGQETLSVRIHERQITLTGTEEVTGERRRWRTKL